MAGHIQDFVFVWFLNASTSTNQVLAARLVAPAPRPRPPTIAAAMAAMVQQAAAAPAPPRRPPGQQYRNLHGRRVDHEALVARHRHEQEELLTGDV